MCRPSFKPTDEQRKQVRSMAAIGLRQEHICEVLQIRSPKTLRKHFAAELAAGHAQAMGTVTRVAFEMAASGRYPGMTMFWLKTHAGWSEDMEPESTGEQDREKHRGFELTFATPYPKTGAQLDGLEKIGTDGELHLYQRTCDIDRRRRPAAAGTRRSSGGRAQEEFNEEE